MVFWVGDNMPIYEYRCGECGHEKEVLQRLNDAPLTDCPKCGKRSFKKLMSAAGFQLKGTGWYATDFKNSGAKPAAKTDKAGTAQDKPAATQDKSTATQDKPSATQDRPAEKAGKDAPKAQAATGGGATPAS
jgi:putative FmdB family regulatory protein